MTNKNMTVFKIDGPILPGTISVVWSKCGKRSCRCHQSKEHRHGPYYRWTGWIRGRATTITLSKEIAMECKRRIANYRKLQRQFEIITAAAIKTAPWVKNTQTG
jgi:hypothetical protein